jgi:hypothetical protein
MSIQEFTIHFNLLRQEGAIFMSLGGQFYMSPDNMRLYPLLDLSKPMESQGAAVDQIHEDSLELLNWWMGIR